MKAETRNFTRKPIRGQAFLVFPDMRLKGKPKDLSLDGICVFVPEQIPQGLACTVGLETTMEGQVVRLVASAKVVYSILSGTDGFRTGLQFTEMDVANNKTLASLMLGAC